MAFKQYGILTILKLNLLLYSFNSHLIVNKYENGYVNCAKSTEWNIMQLLSLFSAMNHAVFKEKKLTTWSGDAKKLALLM